MFDCAATDPDVRRELILRQRRASLALSAGSWRACRDRCNAGMRAVRCRIETGPMTWERSHGVCTHLLSLAFLSFLRHEDPALLPSCGTRSNRTLPPFRMWH